MSAGAFEDGKYEQSGSTFIWPCRVQPETKGLTLNAVANAYPAGDVTLNLPTLEISKRGRRSFGVIPRVVTVRLTADGTGAQAEYTSGSQYTVPVFQQSVWDGYGKQQTGTYLGIACEFVGKSSQEVK